MAAVAMLALRPWKLTSYRVVLAHVLHLPAGAASSEDLLSWGWAMGNYAIEQRRFNKKAGFSQRPDFPQGLLQAGFALPFLQVLVPRVGKGGKAQGPGQGRAMLPCSLVSGDCAVVGTPERPLPMARVPTLCC